MAFRRFGSRREQSSGRTRFGGRSVLLRSISALWFTPHKEFFALFAVPIGNLVLTTNCESAFLQNPDRSKIVLRDPGIQWPRFQATQKL